MYAFTECGLPVGAVRNQSCGEETILSFLEFTFLQLLFWIFKLNYHYFECTEINLATKV